MQKQAESKYPLMEEVAARWSPRAFADRPVAHETLGALFAAAQWSASCFNEQPWRFIVALRQEREAFAKVLSCLVASNQTWAERAPVLVLCLASEAFAHNGKTNRHAWHDLGIASGALSLQAAHLGLSTHFMAGIQRDRIPELFNVPEGIAPVTGLAIGYPGEPDSLPESLRDRERAPRSRKPLSELVFGTQWGRPLGL